MRMMSFRYINFSPCLCREEELLSSLALFLYQKGEEKCRARKVAGNPVSHSKSKTRSSTLRFCRRQERSHVGRWFVANVDREWSSLQPSRAHCLTEVKPLVDYYYFFLPSFLPSFLSFFYVYILRQFSNL